MTKYRAGFATGNRKNPWCADISWSTLNIYHSFVAYKLKHNIVWNTDIWLEMLWNKGI